MDQVQHHSQGLQDGRSRLRDSEGRKPDHLRLLSRSRIRNAAASEAEKDCDCVGILESGRFQQKGQKEEKDADLRISHISLLDGIKQIRRWKNKIIIKAKTQKKTFYRMRFSEKLLTFFECA
jgi:hypothetical protein